MIQKEQLIPGWRASQRLWSFATCTVASSERLSTSCSWEQMELGKVKRCYKRVNCQKELVQDMLQFLVVLGEIFNKMCWNSSDCHVRVHKKNRCSENYISPWDKALRHRTHFNSLPWLRITHFLGRISRFLLPSLLPSLSSPSHSSN